MREKHAYAPAGPSRSRRAPFELRNAGWVCLGAMVMWLIMRTPSHSGKARFSHHGLKANHAEPNFDWESLASHHHLTYTDCFGNHQCARLKVRMDHFNATTNATVDLAIIRRPATVSITDPRYGGAVLLNPGGPGGSGVGFLLRAGMEIQYTIGSNASDGKQYDLISFDPRGVGSTVPRVQCFDSPVADQSFSLRYNEEGLLDSSDAALGRLWAMSTAKGRSCSMPHNSNYDVDFKKYLSTAYVARDMLEIVERHGAWREREAAKLLRRQTGRLAAAVVPKSLKYQAGKEQIQYWGFSYGSYLGNTFAAMFPDRIKRLIVDGVVDFDNYRAALWSNNLLDTEKAMDQFYIHCARVGYPACELANKNGTDTHVDIKDRVGRIIAGLFHNPLPVVGTNPEVITYSDVRMLIFSSLYIPMKKFPNVANLLTQIAEGNGTEFASQLLASHTFGCKTKEASAEHQRLAGDVAMAIACSDGDDQNGVSNDEFRNFIKELADLSPTVGTIWSQIRLNCIHYGVKATYRFVGPWQGKTSHPLLTIGNTADPVTPVAFAHKAAAGFEGAVALTQDSPGHCSISAHSNCTIQYIKDYFQSGRLPLPGTTCQVDVLPFGPHWDAVQTQSDQLRHSQQRYSKIMDALQASGGLFMQHLHIGDGS